MRSSRHQSLNRGRSRNPLRSKPVSISIPRHSLLGFALAGLGCFVGCADRDFQHPIADQITPETLAAQMSVQTALAMPHASGESHLAQFAQRSSLPIRWSFGGFDSAAATDLDAAFRSTEISGRNIAKVGAAVTLVQNTVKPSSIAADDQRESASDRRPVEQVQTPPAQPEIKAELIPTPAGVRDAKRPVVKPERDPDARIAADVAGVNSTSKSGTAATPEMAADGQRVVPPPALIDPTTELGLVGALNGPEDFSQWPMPDVVLFVTGDQHGYIEPCGCTGLDKQKGGVARRFTFMNQLREKGWQLVPIDAGNQIRRIGQQAAIKFEKSTSALTQMKYNAVGFGPGDLRLNPGELIAYTFTGSPEDSMFASANLILVDPELLATYKLVRSAEWNVGITSILDPDSLQAPLGSDVSLKPIKVAAESVLKEMNAAGANFRVLTFFGEESVAKTLMVDVPGFDLIVVSGGYGEPTYKPMEIDGSETKMIVTGNKGMFAGLVGLYQNQPFKYARVPLTHEYADAPEMRTLMAEYQQQLEQLGLSGLGLSPIPHASGEKFVGTDNCAKCHTKAYAVWKDSGHALATEHLVKPTEGRGDVARHFDPECLSCHVTGWNPQNYSPYLSGYLSLETSAHLTGNGCENCHGPGAGHSAAEAADSGVSEERKKSLRMAMQLPLEKARERCMECHDLDNSPDFHDDGAFEDVYWPQVEHYGVD